MQPQEPFRWRHGLWADAAKFRTGVPPPDAPDMVQRASASTEPAPAGRRKRPRREGAQNRMGRRWRRRALRMVADPRSTGPTSRTWATARRRRRANSETVGCVERETGWRGAGKPRAFRAAGNVADVPRGPSSLAHLARSSRVSPRISPTWIEASGCVHTQGTLQRLAGRDALLVIEERGCVGGIPVRIES